MSEGGDLAAGEPRYRLRLFVAGTSMLSRRTIANLRRLCAEHLPGQADLEVVDIFQQPHLAEENQVVAAPTLVKLSPPPPRRIVGDLSDEARALRALGVQSQRPGRDER